MSQKSSIPQAAKFVSQVLTSDNLLRLRRTRMARILIIDDDAMFAGLMVRALTQRGHEVEIALEGEAGSRAFAKSRFDAVVCDILMPVQEGFQTIGKMRTDRPDVVIVAISGGMTSGREDSIDVLAIAEKLGANLSLKKPFGLSGLADAVERLLAVPRAA